MRAYDTFMDNSAFDAAVEAEQALLGAILYDNAAIQGLECIRPDHFVEPLHTRIYRAVAEAIDKGHVADPFTIAPVLAGDPAFAEVDGVRYLANLYERAPPAINAPDYARSVSDAAIKRALVDLGRGISALGLEPGSQTAFERLSVARSELDKLEVNATPAEHTMIGAHEASAQAVEVMHEMARSGKRRGRMTGLRCVDRRLGGLRQGALIVIGGRPSMGKTSLARAIAHGAAVRNPELTALFMGIEMGPEEMMQRELSSLAWEMAEEGGFDPIQYRSMSEGALTSQDLHVLGIVQRYVPHNLMLDDCHSLSVEDVRRKVWTLQRKRPVSVVVIDYLQLMRRPDAKGRNEATVLGEMTAGLKQIARQAKTCIVLLSQLSRGVENRDDKRPQLSDLRESGAIEQDADAVLFPYREAYYLERSEPKSGGNSERLDWEMKCADARDKLDVICAKQRQGPVGTDRQLYEPAYDNICDMPAEDYK